MMVCMVVVSNGYVYECNKYDTALITRRSAVVLIDCCSLVDWLVDWLVVLFVLFVYISY